MSEKFIISSNLVDILNKKIFPAEITVADGKIQSIKETGGTYNNFILPGFIDAHVHVESSMLIPSEFARLAVVHGTVAAVSDPHEIANVLGIDGIRYMIDNGKKVPFKFYFGASSCVPATTFETAGAEVTPGDIRKLFEEDGLHYLSEMMNYPGVLFDDPVVMEKLKIARELDKPVDGHAPGLRGVQAKKYIDAGISTDHECFTLDEALEKINYGMKILIREGSAAKNFEALHSLLLDYPDMVMLCSDDKHPNDLVKSHIDELVRRAIAYGYDVFDVLKCVCINPVEHYKLDVGLLREGDPADFIVVNNLKEFKVQQTYINGELAAENGKTLIKRVDSDIVNNFNTQRKSLKDFEVEEPMFVNNDGTPSAQEIRVIEALEGQLITNELHLQPLVENGKLVSDSYNDILKIAVVERYGNTKPAVAFIKDFGLKKGAIASCVAHDSHNIIAVGVSDEDICNAVNAVIDSKGGISAAYDGKVEVLPLPVAGIMTNEDGYTAAEKYSKIDAIAKEFGTKLKAPFMTLSFMALLVIPQLKLSDKGLFDGGKFEFVKLEVTN
ncbi:MAG: adenine deaminase [Ignavibacteriae bacterium]|nr:MAG: adenine deaminase [Ignavibacteriota bacterium]